MKELKQAIIVILLVCFIGLVLERCNNVGLVAKPTPHEIKEFQHIERFAAKNVLNQINEWQATK